MNKEKSADVFDVLIDVLFKVIELMAKTAWQFFLWCIKKTSEHEKFKWLNGVIRFFDSEVTINVKRISFSDLHCKVRLSGEEYFGYAVTLGKKLKNKAVRVGRATLIFGTPGSGKTVLINKIIDKLLEDLMAIIYLDFKGDKDSQDDFIAINLRKKTQFGVMSPSYNGPYAIGINPLKEGDVTQICQRIMQCLDWSDGDGTFYKAVAESVLMKAIHRIHTSIKTRKIMKSKGWESLTGEELRQAALDTGGDLAAKKVKISPDDPQAKLAHYLSDFDYVTFENLVYVIKNMQFDGINKDDYLGLIVQLESICACSYGPLMNAKNALGMNEMRENGYNVYVGISSNLYGKVAKTISRFLTSSLKHHVGHTNTYKTKYGKNFAVIIDEFRSAFDEDWQDVVGMSRSAGINLVVATQSPSDLRARGDAVLSAFMNCFSEFWVSRGFDTTDIEALAGAFGTIKDKKVTKQTSGEDTTGRGSERDVNRYLCHPDILRNLKTGQFVYKSFGTGDQEILLSLFNVAKLDLTKELSEIAV